MTDPETDTPAHPRPGGPLLIDIVELKPGHHAEAAAVLADAFIDDPAWLAIGPKRREARHRLLSGYYDILVKEALEFAGPSWCAVSDGRVVGVAIVYPDGLQFPPPRADLREAPPFLRAGPGPALRGLRVDMVMKGAHPSHDHLLLWYLAAHPDVQGRGVGATLVTRVRAQAAGLGLPIYLDTTNPKNLPWYQLHGFRVTGEAPMVRGARVWFLHQDVPAG